MTDIIESIQSSISAFDLIVFLIVIYSMAQCTAKGFMMSLLSFSKWLLALIITIILVPKLNPWIQNYKNNDYKSRNSQSYIKNIFIINGIFNERFDFWKKN